MGGLRLAHHKCRFDTVYLPTFFYYVDYSTLHLQQGDHAGASGWLRTTHYQDTILFTTEKIGRKQSLLQAQVG